MIGNPLGSRDASIHRSARIRSAPVLLTLDSPLMNKASFLLGLGSLLTLSISAVAQQAQTSFVIAVDGESFATWGDYLLSSKFQELGLRCGMPELDAEGPDGLPPSDCSSGSTTISPAYAPSGGLIQIPVVVHIIQNTNGAGAISDALVNTQIRIINEDFLALPGTNGSPGADCQIQFYLANRDPNGNPTTGITRSTNNTWFADGGQYWNTLAWDTNRYVNIYTNSASGALGYVPGLPQNGIVGALSDRIVILWSSFGLNGPIGPPYNKGRTTTPGLGHYFGLYHTFQSGCAAASNCYGNGDRICDTNPDGTSHFGCPNSTSCSSVDPVHNYMEYTDDLCMWEFTPEQANRMRCSIMNYRFNLPRPATSILSSTPLTAGSFASFTVSQVTPNKQVMLGYSLTGGGPTYTPFGSASLSDPIRVLASMTSRENGVASFESFVPLGSQGVTIWLQGFDVTTAGVSNGIEVTIQ